MKALYFDGKLALREAEMPRTGPEEALVEVLLAGLCGTDREILKGYSSFRGIPGHEFVGRVVECRDRNWQGKRVVGEINVACGECEYCLWGLGRHCPRRTVMGIVKRDGALAAAAEILEQLQSLPTRRVLVLGDGRLGLLVAQVLHTAAAQITVAGKHASKLALARSWGLTVADVLKDPLPSAAFAVVVEATGSPTGLTEALRLVEPRGTVVMKSTFRDSARFDTAKLVVDEINLLGSRCGSFSAALELIRRGHVKVQELVSKTFPLDAGLEAFEYLDQPACLKVLVKPPARTTPFEDCKLQ